MVTFDLCEMCGMCYISTEEEEVRKNLSLPLSLDRALFSKDEFKVNN